MSLRLAKLDVRVCVVIDDVEASQLSDPEVPGLAQGKELSVFHGVTGVHVRNGANISDQTFNGRQDGFHSMRARQIPGLKAG